MVQFSNFKSITYAREHFKNGKINFLLATCFALWAIFIGCNKDYDNGGRGIITMTTSKAGNVTFFLAGSGTFTIDWGDGSAIITDTLIVYDDFYWNNFYYRLKYMHSYDYSSTSSRTITLTGEKITHISCRNNQLTSLDISKNIGIIWFECGENQLSSLDVSRNTALIDLRCGKNQLTSLDVRKNIALTHLSCSDNQLINLDVRENTELTHLDCYMNQLIDLDVSKNIALKYMCCAYNQLKSLDVSTNTALTQLEFYNNKIINLDLSKNSELLHLSCSDNQLASLDISRSTKLWSISCNGNELTSLDVSNNIWLIALFVNDNKLDNNALNSLFRTLNDNSFGISKSIYIGDNPGTDNCDRSIATDKGWDVNNTPDWLNINASLQRAVWRNGGSNSAESDVRT